MRATHTLLAFLLLITFANFHKALAEDVESATETNEIIPREAIEKLDFSVRQALLRAIDRLEQEEAEKEKQENFETETTTTNLNTLITTLTNSSAKTTKDEILEESVAPDDDVIPTVQFFTATFDEKNTQEQPLSSFIDRSKVWKKTSKVSKQSSFGAPVVVSEFETSQSHPNHQAARSVGGSSVRSNEISNEQSDEIKFEIRSSKNIITSTTTTTTTRKPQITKRKPKPTTTTTTTTTTPRPTHNEDGENIEVVDKQDIKIQEAPLVTAFTVDLDERGSTKKVVPIIHSELPNVQRVAGPTIAKLNVLPAGSQSSSFIPTALPTQSTKLTTSASNPLPGIPVTERPTQLNTSPPGVNNFLIERQRQLEQQIYQLKLQAQQQQELILRQLKILEQQSQIRNEAPTILSSPQQSPPLPTAATLLPQQRPQQQQQLQNQQDFGFTIRPSIEFIPSTHTKTVTVFSPFPAEQQLPLNDLPNKFINSNFNTNNNNNNNNNINNNNNNNNNNVTPNSISNLQSQQLPLNNPVRQIFHNLQNLQNSQVTAAPTNLAPTTLQIQPSNQFSFVPTVAPALDTAKTPLELSVFQPLPQHNFQQFQQSPPLVPSYVTNAILQRQQQQQQHQNPQHNRFFRQETGTANFGSNQVEIQPSNSFNSNLPSSTSDQQTIDNQNFYRQHLDPQLSNQLQQNAQQYYEQQHQQQQQSTAALNHGINAFGAQNLRFNGGGF